MRKLMRGAFVIGRRDFSATVLSKTFLFFLLGPLFPLIFGGVFGGIVGGAVGQRDKTSVAVIAMPADFAPLQSARERLAGAIDNDRVVQLVRVCTSFFAARRRAVSAGSPSGFQAMLVISSTGRR